MAAKKKATTKRATRKKATKKKAAQSTPPDPSKPLKNGQHEKFAQAVFNGSTQADAFREAYPHSVRWKDKTVYSRASTLAGKVQGRIQWLQSQVASDNIMSKVELAELYTGMLRTSHADFMEMTDEGVQFKDLTDEHFRFMAVKKLKTKRFTNGDGDTVIERHVDEIELESRTVTGKALADLMGYNEAQKHEVSGDVNAIFNMPPPDGPVKE